MDIGSSIFSSNLEDVQSISSKGEENIMPTKKANDPDKKSPLSTKTASRKSPK